MRAVRVKWLKKLAKGNPSNLVTGFYGGTWIRGGAHRTYRFLQAAWKAGVR